jgi:hypothetical protein
VQHRSRNKVGYGLAGTAVVILLYPISWGLGTFLFAASLFEGANHSTSDSAKYLYTAPVSLSGKLFAKATKSKEQWQASLEKSIQEKTQLESKRLEVFNEVTALNEQLENQITKLMEIRLLHDSISLVERVRQLPQLSGKTKTTP